MKPKLTYYHTVGIVAFLSLFFSAFPAFSETSSAKLELWVAALKVEAESRGVTRFVLDNALKNFVPIKRVIELDRRQPEFTLTFKQYLSRVMPNSRIKKGRQKLKENKKVLALVQAKYGVQPRFIIALWGIETDFGRVDGGFPVISALATLAFDGRRSKFFRRQLFSALNILDQGHISLEKMRGSWAGAMGQFQFMPTSFDNFAVDHDGDGKRDIWRNKLDAFASAANYLSKSGWRGDQTWGRQVSIPDGFNKDLMGLKIRRKMTQWHNLGVRRLGGGRLPKRNLVGSLIKIKGPRGPIFLTYKNFVTIQKWNKSNYFALAVGMLAEKIGGG